MTLNPAGKGMGTCIVTQRWVNSKPTTCLCDGKGRYEAWGHVVNSIDRGVCQSWREGPGTRINLTFKSRRVAPRDRIETLENTVNRNPESSDKTSNVYINAARTVCASFALIFQQKKIKWLEMAFNRITFDCKIKYYFRNSEFHSVTKNITITRIIENANFI